MEALAVVVGRCCWQLVHQCLALTYWTVHTFGQALRLGFAIIRPVKPAPSVSAEEAAQLLAWVEEQLPGRHVTNLGTDWCDGLLLAELVNALAPRSVPPERLSPDRPAKNVTLAVESASHLLKVDETLSVTEVLEATNQPQLAAYLTQLRRSAQRLQRRFTLIKTESFIAENPEPVPECTAFGTGLMKAKCGRPANFTVSLPRTGPMDLLIELRSDGGDFFTQRLTPRSPPRVLLGESLQSTLGARLAPNIPLGYQMRGKSVVVTYQPVRAGRLVVGVIHAAQHVPGSPFRLSVAPATAEPETTAAAGISECQQQLWQRPGVKSRVSAASAERRSLTIVREASKEDELKTPPLFPVSKTQAHSALTVPQPAATSEQAGSPADAGVQHLLAGVKFPSSDDTRSPDSDVFSKRIRDDISKTLNKVTIDSSLLPWEGMECSALQDIDTCTISLDESTIRHPALAEACRISGSTLNSQHCANTTKRGQLTRLGTEVRAGPLAEQCLEVQNNDSEVYPADDSMTETGQHQISLRSDPDGMAAPPLASAVLVRAALDQQQTKSKKDSSRSSPESREIFLPRQQKSENRIVAQRWPPHLVNPTPANQAVKTSWDRQVCPEETSEHAWPAATIPHDPEMVPEATEMVSIMNKHSHAEPSAGIITDGACVQALALDGSTAKQRPHSSTANEIHVNRSGQRANSDAADSFLNECPERNEAAALMRAAADASVQAASNSVGAHEYKLDCNTMKDVSHLVGWATFQPAPNEPQMPTGSPTRPLLIKQRTIGHFGSASQDIDGQAERTQGAEKQSIHAAADIELTTQRYIAEETEVLASSSEGSDNEKYDGDIGAVGSKIHATDNNQAENGIATSIQSQGNETVRGTLSEGAWSLYDFGAETLVHSSTCTENGTLPQNDAGKGVQSGLKKTDETFFIVNDINDTPASNIMKPTMSSCTTKTVVQSESEKKERHHRPLGTIAGKVIITLSDEHTGTERCRRPEEADIDSSGEGATFSPGNCGGNSDMYPTLAELPVAAHSLRHHPSTPGAEPYRALITPEDVATTVRPGESSGAMECDSSPDNYRRTRSEDRCLVRGVSSPVSPPLERCGTCPSREGTESLTDVPPGENADACTVQLEGGSEQIKCHLAENELSQSIDQVLENDCSQTVSREIVMNSCVSQNLTCVRQNFMENKDKEEREIHGYQHKGGISTKYLQNTSQIVPQSQGSKEESDQLTEQDCVEGRELLTEQDCVEGRELLTEQDCVEGRELLTEQDCVEGRELLTEQNCVEGRELLTEQDCVEGRELLTEQDCVEGRELLTEQDCVEGRELLTEQDCVEGRELLSEQDCVEGRELLTEQDCVEGRELLSEQDCVEGRELLTEQDCVEGRELRTEQDCVEGRELLTEQDCVEGRELLTEQDCVEGRELLTEQGTGVGAKQLTQQVTDLGAKQLTQQVTDFGAKQLTKQGADVGAAAQLTQQDTEIDDEQLGGRDTEKCCDQAKKPDTSTYEEKLTRQDTEECFRLLAEQYGVNDEPVIGDTASNSSSPSNENVNAGTDQLKAQHSERAGGRREARDGGTDSDIPVRKVGLGNSQPKDQCAGSAIEQESRLDTETTPHPSNSHQTEEDRAPPLCSENVSDKPEHKPAESNKHMYKAKDAESDNNHINYLQTVTGDTEAELIVSDCMETATPLNVVDLNSEGWQQTTSDALVISTPGHTDDKSSPNGPSPLPGSDNHPNLLDFQSTTKYIGETVVQLGRPTEKAQGLIEPQVLQFNQHKPYLQPGVVLEAPSGIIRRSGDIDSFPAVGSEENGWPGGECVKSPSRPSTTASTHNTQIPAERRRKFSDQYRQFSTPTEPKYRLQDNQARSKVYLGLTVVRVREAPLRYTQLLPCLLLPPQKSSNANNADSQKGDTRQISDKSELPDMTRQSTKPSPAYPVHSDSPAPSQPTPSAKETLPSTTGGSQTNSTRNRETKCDPNNYSENADSGKEMSSAIDYPDLRRETCDREFPVNSPVQNPPEDSTERAAQDNVLIDKVNHGNTTSSPETEEDDSAPSVLFPRSKPPEKSAVFEEIIDIQDHGANDVILEAMILEPRSLKALARSPDTDDGQQCLRESSEMHYPKQLGAADPNKSLADAPPLVVSIVPSDSAPQNELASEKSIMPDMDDTNSETSSCGTLNTTGAVRDSSPEWSDSDSSRSSFQSVVSAMQQSPSSGMIKFTDVFEAGLDRELVQDDKIATDRTNHTISDATPISPSASPSFEHQQTEKESKSSLNAAADAGTGPAVYSRAEQSYPVSLVKTGSGSYSETFNEQAVSSIPAARAESPSGCEFAAEPFSTSSSNPASALTQPHCQPVPLSLPDRAPHPQTHHSHNNDANNCTNLISTRTIYYAPGSPPRERRDPVLLKYVRTNSDQGQFRRSPAGCSNVTPMQTLHSESYHRESSRASPRTDSSPFEDEQNNAGHKEDGDGDGRKVQSSALSQQLEDTPREKTVVNGKPNAAATCDSFGRGPGDGVMSRVPSGRNWQLQPVKPLKTEDFIRALTRTGQKVPEALQRQTGREQPGQFTEFDFEERKRMLRNSSQHDVRPHGVPDEGLLSWGHVVRLRSKYEQLSEMRSQRQHRHRLRGSRSMVNLPQNQLFDSEPPELVVVPLNEGNRWENRNGNKTTFTDMPVDALKQQVSVQVSSAPQGTEHQQFPSLTSQCYQNTPQERAFGCRSASGSPVKMPRSQSSWELASISAEESRFHTVQQYFAAIRDGQIAPVWGSSIDLSDHSSQKASIALLQEKRSPERGRQGRFDLDLVGIHRTLTTLARADTLLKERAEDDDSGNELLNVEETVFSSVAEARSGISEPRVMAEYPYLSRQRSRTRLVARNLLKHEDLVRHSKERVTVFGSGLYQGTVDADNRFMLFVPDAESAPHSVHVHAVHQMVTTRAELRYVWHRYHEVTYRVSAAGWYRLYVHMGGSASDVDVIVRIRR